MPYLLFENPNVAAYLKVLNKWMGLSPPISNQLFYALLYGKYGIWCRYAVPAESAAAFEAALQQQHGPEAVSQLTAKHLYCALPIQLLKKLGVRRFLQMPGYAVLTYPVSFSSYQLH